MLIFNGNSHDLHKLLFSEDEFGKYFEFCGIGASRVVFKFNHLGVIKVVKYEYVIAYMLDILPSHIKNIIDNSENKYFYGDSSRFMISEIEKYVAIQNKVEIDSINKIHSDYYLGDIIKFPIVDELLSNLILGIIVMDYWEPLSKIDISPYYASIDSSLILDMVSHSSLSSSGSFLDYIGYLNEYSGVGQDVFEEQLCNFIEASNYISDVNENNIAYCEEKGFIVLDLGLGL